MKRRFFLRLSAVIVPVLTAPFTGRGTSTAKKRPDKGFKVDAGKDRFDQSISLFDGDTFYCKVSTKDTDGDLYAFESSRVKKGGPPLHYHYEQDEWFYILEGEFLIKVGEQSFQAKAGDTVFGPRRIPHAFAKTNEGAARMLIIFQPAGKMETFFQAVNKGALTKLSEAERHKFRQDHGFEVVGPALIQEKI